MEPEKKDGKSNVGLMDKVREQIPVLKERVKEEVESLKEPEKTQLYKSVFRVKHDETPRNRSLGVEHLRSWLHMGDDLHLDAGGIHFLEANLAEIVELARWGMRRDASRTAVAVSQFRNPKVFLDGDDSLLGRHAVLFPSFATWRTSRAAYIAGPTASPEMTAVARLSTSAIGPPIGARMVQNDRITPDRDGDFTSALA